MTDPEPKTLAARATPVRAGAAAVWGALAGILIVALIGRAPPGPLSAKH